ncbi:hypothetical protein PspLS_01973 [Pyricularia sp. CBS 133598]|nr:hypothetical protein PspLS_01973 [Pyricularia sp. CBS 133598]
MDFELFRGSISGNVSEYATYNALELAGDLGGNTPYRILRKKVNSAVNGIIKLCSESDSDSDYTANFKNKTKPGNNINRDLKPRRLSYPVLYNINSTYHIFANKQFFTHYTPGCII